MATDIRCEHRVATFARGLSGLRTSFIAFLLMLTIASLPGCVSASGTGAGVGAGFGAGIGAAVDDDNPWRGAVIGGALGGLLGFAVGDTVDRERRAAAEHAYYESEVYEREFSGCGDGERYRVRAEPAHRAHRVTTTVWREDPATGEWTVVSESEELLE